MDTGTMFENVVEKANMLFGSKFQAKDKLIKFIGTHGIEALQDLNGFIQYTKKLGKNEREKALYATLGHDLSGCDDELMLPRSYGYAGYA